MWFLGLCKAIQTAGHPALMEKGVALIATHACIFQPPSVGILLAHSPNVFVLLVQGKAQQTIYHVFALDVEKDASWCSWQPAVTDGTSSDADTSQADIVHKENSIVGTVCGHLWLDLDMLINMCSNKTGPNNVSPPPPPPPHIPYTPPSAYTSSCPYIEKHCTTLLIIP